MVTSFSLQELILIAGCWSNPFLKCLVWGSDWEGIAIVAVGITIAVASTVRTKSYCSLIALSAGSLRASLMCQRPSAAAVNIVGDACQRVPQPY